MPQLTVNRSVTDATALRTIYKVGAPFPKTDYYAPFQTPGVGVDIFSERNEAIHGKYKRQFAQIYSASGVKDLDANIDNSIQRFICHLQNQGAENINLGKWVERLLFGMTRYVLNPNCITDIQQTACVIFILAKTWPIWIMIPKMEFLKRWTGLSARLTFLGWLPDGKG